MFRQADEYFSIGKYKESLAVLDNMEKMFGKDRNIVPRILAAKMAGHAKLGNVINALKLQDRVKSDYPGYEGLAEMLFTAGDLASKAADYEQARKYFLQIPALRPDSAIAAAAAGRAGDSFFALFSKTFKKEYLKEAAIQYKNVLKNKNISAQSRVQAAYKLGRCYESMDDQRDAALNKFCEAVFSVDPAKAKEIPESEKVWIVKAAYAAARIYARPGGKPEDAANAVRIYQLLKKMNLQTGERFDELISTLKDKYRLR